MYSVSIYTCTQWVYLHILSEYIYMYSVSISTCTQWVYLHILSEYIYMYSTSISTCTPWVYLHVLGEYIYIYSMNCKLNTCTPVNTKIPSIIFTLANSIRPTCTCLLHRMRLATGKAIRSPHSSPISLAAFWCAGAGANAHKLKSHHIVDKVWFFKTWFPFHYKPSSLIRVRKRHGVVLAYMASRLSHWITLQRSLYAHPCCC